MPIIHKLRQPVDSMICKPGMDLPKASLCLVSWHYFCSRYWHVCVCVRVSVCLCMSASMGINNQWCNMVWYRSCVIGWISYDRHLPLIKWMSVALVTQSIMNIWQQRQTWYHTSLRRSYFDYLAVGIKRSGLVIKVSGRKLRDAFKRKLVDLEKFNLWVPGI